MKKKKEFKIDFSTAMLLVFLTFISSITSLIGVAVVDNITEGLGGLAMTFVVGFMPLFYLHAFLSFILNNSWK